jgi:periplasmic divalent cation tolerance protein
MTPYPQDPVHAVGPMRLVLSSYPSHEAAVAAARGSVERRLAACAQIVATESRFWWEGKVETASESMVLFKTVPKRVGALFGYLRSSHPYDVPEIVEIDVPRLEPGFLRYLAATLDATALAPPPASVRRRAAPRARAGRGPARTRARPHRRSR